MVKYQDFKSRKMDLTANPMALNWRAQGFWPTTKLFVNTKKNPSGKTESISAKTAKSLN